MKRILVSFLLFIIIFSIPIDAKASITSEPIKKLKVDSRAAILIDLKTGKILYEKNIHSRLAPASTTKILTAIIALEKGNLNRTVTVGKGPTLEEPSKIYLKNGEKIKLKDLIYAIMLPSANDAAEAIAEYIGGSRTGFAKLMNNKARALGCKDSNFLNPNGLYNSKHLTTAYDLSLIAKYAMKNSQFRKIVSTKAYTILRTNKSGQRKLTNHNKMLYKSEYYYSGCIGIKTGYTSQSNHTLVSSATSGHKNLLAVTLDDTTLPYNDVKKMFDYGFSLKK